MTTEELLQNNFKHILDIARLAPSVHNTQPWVVRINGASLEISLNSRYVLTDGDPTGRQTTISLGIFCEAICLAADSLGLRATKLEQQSGKTIMWFALDKTSAQTNHKIELLRSRATDRSIYQPAEVSQAIVNSIINMRSTAGVNVHVTVDKATLEHIAKLTAQGIKLALSSPNFRKELSGYLVRPGSSKKRGIATKSLYIPWLIQIVEPWLLRFGIGLDAEVKLEKRRWQSATAVVIITSKGDMHGDWFEVGRSYLQVSLAIEEAGLSQATSAAIVEASTFHEDIEQILGTNQRIQAMIRIGAGKNIRHHSPRVDTEELLSTSN